MENTSDVNRKIVLGLGNTLNRDEGLGVHVLKALEQRKMKLICHLPTFVSTADLTDSIRESSGLSSAFASNSGRIAGKNVLKYLGK